MTPTAARRARPSPSPRWLPLTLLLLLTMLVASPAVAQDGPVGVLVVSANIKGAEVWVDGEQVGTVPYTGYLPVGRHQVRAELADAGAAVTDEAGGVRPDLDTGRVAAVALRGPPGRRDGAAHSPELDVEAQRRVSHDDVATVPNPGRPHNRARPRRGREWREGGDPGSRRSVRSSRVGR